MGLMRRLSASRPHSSDDEGGGGPGRQVVERLAMEAVMAHERTLTRVPRDVSDQRGIGYDIESKCLESGHLFFIEVTGRWREADQVMLTRSEILCALNEPPRFRLALVIVDEKGAREPVYVAGYDYGQAGFEQTGATYPVGALLKRRTQRPGRMG